MGTISDLDFKEIVFTLLKETFEGPPMDSWSVYLDADGGMFQVLSGITAKAASTMPKIGGATIAANCAHAKYYVDILLQRMKGRTESADWEGSWRKQKVSDAEWTALQKDFRQSYEDVMGLLESAEEWDPDTLGVSVAMITHTAYHLSAMRQLVRMVKFPG